ncbi:amino acid ABC transporter substrate-binding protein [Undibacterium rugosum]|uniref:Amino acid ABC transporter substrate-binding protein n=1 Tax=Undibacterium rugosum TaxID=2762291 RepID=A0A923IB66_9BURK|nr:amino acid ABC transporter substrate-binding protein [Undibacterium rugosum]MBC3936883.1 amino acid ABC transporter substrate-binding protein [Undibacterium rugosum]MBR7780085.1 amino acid ABC transporter substrate-binding protein [Undibacterium rugosum]
MPLFFLRNGISILLAFLFAAYTAYASAITQVTYPAGETPNDPRFNDVIEILTVALEKTRYRFGDYECHPSVIAMPKKRYLKELAQDERRINIIWSPSTHALEQEFDPIRIPLRKGLLGYRILIIRKDQQAKFDRIHNLEDLTHLKFGQGVGWVDNQIYDYHGIPVIQGPYGQLFKMLEARRFDAFPRGAGEILGEMEVQQRDHPDLTIEKNLLLYYPFPYYFFFNHQDKELRNRITLGLHIMQKDGSLDAIFLKHHKAAIDGLNLKNRRLIRLENPTLPKSAPLNDATLWYVPGK